MLPCRRQARRRRLIAWRAREAESFVFAQIFRLFPTLRDRGDDTCRRLGSKLSPTQDLTALILRLHTAQHVSEQLRQRFRDLVSSVM